MHSSLPPPITLTPYHCLYHYFNRNLHIKSKYRISEAKMSNSASTRVFMKVFMSNIYFFKKCVVTQFMSKIKKQVRFCYILRFFNIAPKLSHYTIFEKYILLINTFINTLVEAEFDIFASEIRYLLLICKFLLNQWYKQW